MQGNSKYLRWSPLYTCCCVFVILSSTVIAVPVRPRRMVREPYFDAVATNTISNVTCFQDGIEVQKSSVKCEIKTGCKLIQKTGECCPSVVTCQCNHEDRIYENGEKIFSNNPCRRCVCKGGEVTCNEVSCYIRDDCKPRYVKGVCCPQFDNCPPIDDVKISAAKDSDSKLSKNDVIISPNTFGNGTPKDDMQLANENPLGITIKEITKPEEIRITDDKPKPYNPFKSTTTTTTSTTVAPSTTTAESSSESTSKSVTDSTTTMSAFTTESSKESKELSTEDINPSSQTPSDHESREYMEDGSFGDSSSVAPPTKASAEGEVEPEILLASADSNSITDDSVNKSVRQTVEHSTSGDVDQSSEIIFMSSTTEISSESSTPLESLSSESGEIDDLIASSTPKNLVVVRHGGKTESFHISGTDGLQRVEELDVVLSSTTESSSEDSVEGVTQSSEQSVIVSTDNIGGKSSEEMMLLESSSVTGFPETFDESSTVALAMDRKSDQTSMNDSSTESTSISSNEMSTPDDGLFESSSELVASSEKAYDSVYYGDAKSTASPSSEEAFETVFYGPTEDITDSSSTTEGPDTVFSSTDGSFSTTEQNGGSSSETEATSTTRGPPTESPETSSSRFSFEEEVEVTPAENPEYPYIPDDVSIHHKDLVEEEDKRRTPSKVLDEPVSSTAGPPCDECDMAKSGEVSTTQGASVEEIKMSHKMDIIESRAPGEPHLIPEWERSTTQGPDAITAFNQINKTVTILEPVIKTNKSAALTVETLNDVDSDEKYGRKEPTTERPTTKGYADDIEEGSASSAQSEFESSTVDGVSPKDDAESIKLNSSGSSSDENESYVHEAPRIPNAFENYFRYISKVNGWPEWESPS